MAKGQEPTTKFRVDISELKQNMQAAQREIRLANAEFKAATAGMDDWSDSADGLSAKLKQLEKTESAQVKQLELLREQHRLVAEEQGEHSKAAEELAIKIKNQEAAIGRTQKAMSDFSKTVGDVGKEAEEASDGFTVLKGALASLVADGIRAATDAFTDLLVSGEKAMGSFQAKTGASADEMERFGEEIETLYKHNFGDDMQDVADSMALVAQNTKEVDPSRIRELTENAITLRDAFGFEVNETMRAANMLMDQFGITGDEAFALIAQGAQNGLDKNGDLLDSINEYSVHYQQLGVDAEGFFNSLQNGTEAGTFSVDKLGDAVKEFGIRVKDGSDSSAEAFETLGFDADELFQIFNEGGDGAAEMMQKIVTELDTMPEGVEKTTAGVALFGTMWEDLGAEGIKALSNINGEADRTKTVMDEIKEAQYSDIGAQWSEIGRMIKTDFIMPMAEELLPIVKEGLTWIKDNLNTLIPIITGIGTAVLSAFAVAQITSFVSTIGTVVTAVKGASTVAGALKAAMAALNLTMSMNPIGLVVIAITGLVAAFVTLWNTSDEFRAFWIDLWDKIKEGFFTAMDKVKEFFTDTIPELFSKAYAKFNEFKQTARTFIQNVLTFFKELPSGIYDAIVSVIAHIIAWGAKLGDFARNDVPKFIAKVVEFFGTLPSKIWKWLKEALGKIADWGSDMIEKGKEVAADTVDGIIDAFFGLPEDLFSIGSDALTGFWDGLKSVGKTVKDWATGFFGDILDKAEEVLEIGSPSKAMKRIAAWTMQGFNDEAVAKGKKVVQNVRSTFENVKVAASEALGGMQKGSTSFGGTIGAPQGSVQNVTNFYQTNNSPKALSRYEVYRQSKNLLNRGRVHV